MIRNIFLLKSRSLLIRLLWPVNLISTVLLIGFAITLSIQNRTTVDVALRAKAEVVSKLLVQTGEHYIGTKDQNQLSKYASRLDSDVQFVSFFDSMGMLRSGTQLTILSILFGDLSRSHAATDFLSNFFFLRRFYMFVKTSLIPSICLF